MDTSFDIRIWKTDLYEGKRATTYYIRWSVAGKSWKKPFKTAALAESFRAALVTASAKAKPSTSTPVGRSRWPARSAT